MSRPTPTRAGSRHAMREAEPRGASTHWAELQARVEEAGRQLAASEGHSAADTRRILRERAMALAVPDLAHDDLPRLEIMTLELGDRRFAIETRHVMELVRDPPMAPLPGAAAPVAAVAAWRGRLLTVLDLRATPPTTAGTTTAPLLVVLGGERAEIGLVATSVGEIATIALDQLREVPDSRMRFRDYVRALTVDAVPVLDGERLLERHSMDS